MEALFPVSYPGSADPILKIAWMILYVSAGPGAKPEATAIKTRRRKTHRKKE
jgi:hypothetical protein